MKILLVILSLMCLTGCRTDKTKRIPENKDVKWSVAMADAAMAQCDSLIWYNNGKIPLWQYDVAMLGQAIDLLGCIDEKYSRYHEDFIDHLIMADGTISGYDMEEYNLDNVNPAKGLITLYKRNGDEKYLKAINIIIEQLRKQPRTNAGGYWHKQKYPWQMWLDGIYMYAPFLAQYAREFNHPDWFDTIAFQITLIFDKTLDPATGLLYHAWDESGLQAWCNPLTGQSKEFWGRAIGWYMMAIVDVLDYLPEDHPKRQAIIDILVKTSDALLTVRDPGTKLWYQVLNKGSQPGNYIEGSCSAMFTYAFAKGARKGYLPAKYLDIAGECFSAMLTVLIKTDKNGNPVMTNICAGAGLGGDPYRDGSYNYYINEKKRDNDSKGLGPFIFAALELNR